MAALTVTQVSGATVSVAFNEVNNDVSNRLFQPTDIAGVEAVANWNNANAVNNGTYSGFVDSAGAPSTLSISSTTGGGADTWNTWDFTTFDRNINSDWANNLTQMVISGIAYLNYDIIVYAGANFGNDDTDITIGVTTLNLNDTTGGNPLRTPALTQGIDYVRFTGLSGASQTVDFANVANGIGVGGFQVVQVPEPSSALLLGLAGLVAFRRRRA